MVPVLSYWRAPSPSYIHYSYKMCNCKKCKTCKVRFAMQRLRKERPRSKLIKQIYYHEIKHPFVPIIQFSREISNAMLKKQTHGTDECYNRGKCRCIECTRAHRNAVARWRFANREKFNAYMRNFRSSRAGSLEPTDSKG